MIVHTKHTTCGVRHRGTSLFGSFRKSTESRRSSGRANYKRPRAISPPRNKHDLEHSPDWLFPRDTTYFGSFTLSSDPVRSGGQPSCPPPTISHKYYGLMSIKRRRPAALHRLQQLIQHFEILVLRLQLTIFLQRSRGGTQIAELVIDERKVEID